MEIDDTLLAKNELITDTNETFGDVKASMKTLSAGITNYERLYGDRSVSPGEDYIYSERLETRSPKFGWDIKPHIHPGILQIFYIEQGEFLFFNAANKIDLIAPCLLIIPSRALHGFTFNPDVKGHILTMAESYFGSLLPDLNVFSFRANDIISITTFDKICPVERIADLMKTIDQELSREDIGKQLMMQALLQQLFLLSSRLDNADEKRFEETADPSIRHFRKFQQLIRENGALASLKKVASQMALTPVHLNRICKSVSGKTASQIMQEYVISQAKKYLSYTSHSISEIAYLLNYEYPNYFAKFFRKHTGLSPTEFRLLNN